MISPVSTITLWVFYMLYPGYGHEDFNAIKMLGMFLLAGGSFYYVHLEIIDLEREKEFLNTISTLQNSDLQLSETSRLNYSQSKSEIVRNSEAMDDEARNGTHNNGN